MRGRRWLNDVVSCRIDFDRVNRLWHLLKESKKKGKATKGTKIGLWDVDLSPTLLDYFIRLRASLLCYHVLEYKHQQVARRPAHVVRAVDRRGWCWCGFVLLFKLFYMKFIAYITIRLMWMWFGIRCILLFFTWSLLQDGRKIKDRVGTFSICGHLFHRNTNKAPLY